MNQDRNIGPDTPPDPTGDEAVSGTAQAQIIPRNGTQPVAPAVGCSALLLFWLVVILSAVLIFYPAGRMFFVSRWWVWWAVGGFILLALLLPLIGPVRGKFAKAAGAARTGVVVFIVLPVILLGFGTIFLIPTPKYQVTAVRSTFLVAVCLFPALLYYLFIAARKFSLLNDYFVNLNRLGLLRAPSPSAEIECKVRLGNYVQKFEALYGAIVPPLLREKILNADDPLTVLAAATAMWPGKDSGSPGAVFTAETAIPVVLATVVIAAGWLMALPPTGFGEVEGAAIWRVVFTANPEPILYAFLGAYFFSLQLLFRRYTREDLRQSAYLAVSLRIILAVIGTWVAVKAITAMKKDVGNEYLLVVGFVIGVFPRIAWQFIQGAFKALMRMLRLSDKILPSIESELPVSDLDGLTVWHEARLEEEDIENIPNMATTEIVDLMLRTRFPPDRIIDWVDQAILFTYLGPDQEGNKERVGEDDKKRESRKDLLRRCGIRTATSLIQAFEAAQERKGDITVVEKALSDALDTHVQSFIDAMATDSNLLLICAWRGITPPSVPISVVAPPY